MKKKLFAIILIIILLISAIGFIGLGILRFNNIDFTKGRYLTTNNGSPMIIDQNGSPIQLSFVRGNVNIFDDITDGDEILILNDGILETYPAKTGVYWVKKLSDGDYDDLPKETLSNLAELDWVTENSVNNEIISRTLKFHFSPETDTIPQVSIIKSTKELSDYLNNNGDIYSAYCEKYDEEYFKEQILIITISQEGTSAVNQRVNRISLSNDKLEIYIDRYLPYVDGEFTETGDTVMVYHHAIIEPNKALSKEISSVANIETDMIYNIAQGIFVETNFYGSATSLILPTDWEYERIGTRISFWPKGHTGKLTYCCDYDFAVCGTGLHSHQVTIGGNSCYINKFDNSDLWYYISFENNRQIINEGATEWWNEHGDEAMEILETIEY